MAATLRVSKVSDDDLERLSLDNPGWQIERDGDGALVVSPTSSEGGAKSAEALIQLSLWSRSRPGGKLFDSSTGFKMGDGSVLSPDAAWISEATLEALRPEMRQKFWTVAPDVVIEVKSDTDSWPRLQAKIRAYVANGTQYAIAIDPYRRDTFEAGTRPAGLDLNVTAIMDA